MGPMYCLSLRAFSYFACNSMHFRSDFEELDDRDYERTVCAAAPGAFKGMQHMSTCSSNTDLVALGLEAAVGGQPHVFEARWGDGVVPERQPCHVVVVPDLRAIQHVAQL
jgi:hypothetical protein